MCKNNTFIDRCLPYKKGGAIKPRKVMALRQSADFRDASPE